MNRKPENLAVVLYDGIQLFDHEEFLFIFRKIKDLLYGERVYDSKLKY